MLTNNGFIPHSVDEFDSITLFDELQKNKRLVMMPCRTPVVLVGIVPPRHIKFERHGWIFLQRHKLGMRLPKESNVGTVDEPMTWIHDPGIVLQCMCKLVGKCWSWRSCMRVHPHSSYNTIVVASEGPAFYTCPCMEHDQDDLVLTDKAAVIIHEADGIDIKFI